MEYQIAVPSYKRERILIKKTLAVLRRHSIPSDIVTIFVADEEEKDAYLAVLPEEYKERVVTAVPGVGAVRRFIQTYYEEGVHVISMDDDLTEVYEGVNRKEKIPVPDLNGFFLFAFKECLKEKANLWGVYPVNNPYFMRRSITTDLRYIPGALYGCVSTHDPLVRVALDDKEDFERSLKFYLRDGRVVRFNYISMGTIGYEGGGGMQVERTEERVSRSAAYLARAYPGLCKLKISNKGHVEVVLRDQTRKRGR